MIPKVDLTRVQLPAAFVDLDAFDRNLKRMLEFASDKKIRIATKSIRVPDLLKRALAYSPRFQGLMCYSLQEAEFLASQGFDDFFVSYPTAQSSDLETLRGLQQKGRKVALVVDSREHLEKISAIMSDANEPARCAVEVDMSLRPFGKWVHLGVRRSPIRSIEQLTAFLLEARKFRGVRIIGAMGYEAQVAGLSDRNPFKSFLINPIARLIRKISMRSIEAKRRRIAQAFEATGISMELFNGGGTGSLNLACSEKALTEVTAGSGLICSHLFDYYSNISFEPSVYFALQVVRSSDPGYVTCQGGGYIASGEPGWDRVPIPVHPEGLRLSSTEGCGEVQTPLHGPGAAGLKPGDAVWFRHAKAGELAERFNEYHLVKDGKITGSSKTYRGFGECYY
jgi:D-serine deaminase-like pyridoxal phosphate-dependent protein